MQLLDTLVKQFKIWATIALGVCTMLIRSLNIKVRQALGVAVAPEITFQVLLLLLLLTYLSSYHEKAINALYELT